MRMLMSGAFLIPFFFGIISLLFVILFSSSGEQ